MVGRFRELHAIVTLRHHTQSDDVGSGMPAWSLENIDGWTLSSIEWPRPWEAHTVGRCREWYDIMALGYHERLDYVLHGMPSSPLH